MRTLTVELGTRSYPIHIGEGLLDDAALYRAALGTAPVVVVSDDVVAPLYLDRLRAALGPLLAAVHVLPHGEGHKHLGSVEAIATTALEAGLGRDGAFVALGGGVVGDITGFAAACYQRGIPFVQVPTTLLAQVDSSVGGKTGVNHPLGKNMIGAFHQPLAVIADTATLDTLERRHYRAGLAEVIKYGLIRDAALFSWLEEHIDAVLAGQAGAVQHVVERSCAIKAAVVAEDETERGVRALLNLGHTFGHAIETTLGHGTWLHGEAVAAGLVMAAELSARTARVGADVVGRVRRLVARAGLPPGVPPGLPAEVLLAAMQRDKKVLAGRMRLVVLDRVGAAGVTDDVPVPAIRATLDACRLDDSTARTVCGQ